MSTVATVVIAFFASQIIQYYRSETTPGQVVAIENYNVIVSYDDRIDGQRNGIFLGDSRTVGRLGIGDSVEIHYVPGSAFYMWAESIEGANKNLLYSLYILFAIYAAWRVYRRYLHEAD